MVKVFVPVDAVARFKWDFSCGDRLRAKRVGASKGRPTLAKEIATNLDIIEAVGRLQPDSCSPRYIQKLEDGEMETVSPEMLCAIAKVLGFSMAEILDIEIQEKD